MSRSPSRFQSLCRAILKDHGSLRCRALGSSMYPLFRTGNTIEVEPANAENLRPGDVVVYCAGDFLVAHRLIKKTARHHGLLLLTRGDAFDRRTYEEVTPAQVVGRVVAVQRWPGCTVQLRHPAWRLFGKGLSRLAPLLYRLRLLCRAGASSRTAAQS